jgi:hypothetical protein
MIIKTTRFFSGQLVEVRSPNEIFQTLDSNGTLDGLPFMPEMLEFCGRRFRVSRRIQKTCVEVANGDYDIREFPQNDVVFLEELRCSGTGHDECQRACMLFWKVAWLRRAGENRPIETGSNSTRVELQPELKTRSGPSRYLCQSTELIKATRLLSRRRRLLKCVYDVFSGDVGLLKMMGLILKPIGRKLTGRVFSPVEGPMKRTPVEKLDLQPGEIVSVRSVGEITQTLDKNSKNRGLAYDLGLGKFSGHRYKVRNRLDAMISEPTGEMKKPEATVILEDLTCFCNNAIGGCPRRELIYWREIWLTRVENMAIKKEASEVAPNKQKRI